jgi:hypothetical protein
MWKRVCLAECSGTEVWLCAEPAEHPSRFTESRIRWSFDGKCTIRSRFTRDPVAQPWPLSKEANNECHRPDVVDLLMAVSCRHH